MGSGPHWRAPPARRALAHEKLTKEALMLDQQQPFKVMIGGSGPAAIEAALVLRQLSGARVEATVISPDEECVHLPMSVLAPFARSGSTR